MVTGQESTIYKQIKYHYCGWGSAKSSLENKGIVIQNAVSKIQWNGRRSGLQSALVFNYQPNDNIIFSATFYHKLNEIIMEKRIRTIMESIMHHHC